MAQLYEYYHPNPSLPRTSNYSCTASTTGETALGQLMATCGTSAGSRYEFLGGCDTFTWPGDAANGLVNMGFSSNGTSNVGYDLNAIKLELYGSHPIMFWGTTCDLCFSDYHIWLCDGVDEHHYSDFDCDTKRCVLWDYTFLSMNWGWGLGGGYNGWYALGQYNPGGSDYNTNLHMITGIRP